MIFSRKLFIFLIVLILFLFGSWGVYTIKYEHKTYYKDLDVALKEKATQGYLDQHILDAIRDDKIDDAVMYQHLAEFLGVPLNEKTLNEIEKHNDLISKSWRNIKFFGWGFATGESEDMVGLSGAIASDMIFIGDVRDLAQEGNKFVHDQPYDKVILGMSAIGIGLTFSQGFSFGTTTPAKIGASIIKYAKKTGKLSKSFVNMVSSKLSKSIDFNALRKVDYTSIDSVKKASKQISKSLNSPYIRKAFKNIDTIKTNTSIADTIALLKYVDDPKDLRRVANISKKYKNNTKAVFKVLGKGVIKGIVKGTAKIIKWTSLLIAQLISLIVSLAVFLFAFFSKWLGLRSIKKKFFTKKINSIDSHTDNVDRNLEIITLSSDNQKLSKIVLSMDVVIIGRNSDVDIVIENRYISKRHLKLYYIQKTGVIVEDLGSTNGTYIDGKKLLSNVPTVWKRGERLIVGSEDVVYQQ